MSMLVDSDSEDDDVKAEKIVIKKSLESMIENGDGEMVPRDRDSTYSTFCNLPGCKPGERPQTARERGRVRDPKVLKEAQVRFPIDAKGGAIPGAFSTAKKGKKNRSARQRARARQWKTENEVSGNGNFFDFEELEMSEHFSWANLDKLSR